MSPLNLYPKNDLAFVATIKVATDAGVLAPLNTGTGTAFLATSSSSTATAADPSLVGEVVYTNKPGKWLVRFDADLLTPALLASLFANATPYCIVEFEGDVRAVIELAYLDAKLVAVAS